MGRGRGEDLDVAGLREIGKRTDEVATEASSVRLAQSTVRRDIKPRELGAALVRCLREATNVVLGSRDLVVDVLERADIDVTIGKLLDQNRRQPDDDAVRHARISKVVQKHEERQVGAEDGFLDPLLTMRPATRSAAVGKMRMKREYERTHTRILAAPGWRLAATFASLWSDRCLIARRPA